MGISFRHSAGFGKRMEYNLVGQMLMEGLDVYLPLVDDHGVDCIIKKNDGTFIEIQIKARSNEVTDGDAALFAAITHAPDDTPLKNFYFVFYSERASSFRLRASLFRWERQAWLYSVPYGITQTATICLLYACK